MTARRQLGLLWGSVALALVALSPLAERLAAGLPACPVKSIVDLPCVTCGTTRAALALADLDLSSAWLVNPLATLFWIAVILGGGVAGLASLIGRPLPIAEPRPSVALRAVLLVLLLGNWVYLIVAGV